jgi:hypothetical protein
MTDNLEGLQKSAERKKVIAYLSAQLIGPTGGEEEILPSEDKVYERYLMGALFPKGAGNKKIEVEENAGDTGSSDEEDNPMSLAYQVKPASVGLSFYTTVDTVQVELSAARYLKEKVDGISKWKRRPVFTKKNPETCKISTINVDVPSILGGHAQLRSKWRKMGKGWLVTVSVVSNHDADESSSFDPEDVLFQLWMRCRPVGGNIEGYPSPDRYSWDKEEEELALIYRKKKTFAIGHGVAATWDAGGGTSESVMSVETSFIPEYEVPAITANLPKDHPLTNSEVFSLQFLSNQEIDFSKKLELLQSFVTAYADFLEIQVNDASELSDYNSAADRIVKKMNDALQRMQKGLEWLSNNKDARNCFELSNLAMLMQMVHSSDSYSKNQKARGTRYVPPEYFDEKWKNYRWRPFQLAFQLLVLESLANRGSSDRDVLDLIWFPTGGGKTEAYLAVAAFEMFYRRMKFGDAGGGTAVIKRYTLRLLTAQQFQRTSTLICACEIIRRSQLYTLGDEPFTLGLWVGEDTSPNKFQGERGAFEKFKEIRDQEKPENPFQLQKCPCCGTRIIPEYGDDDSTNFGIKADAASFSFFCPENSCEFHQYLPINVIDDHLYKYPPTFLVGTIDKFARLAWKDEPRAFFCGGVNGERQPPSLIIQDEMHLISGPLGTIAGLYEAAMDVVMNSVGGRPKYIAATATIRRANEQVKRLYARDVTVFPPAGINAENAFFSMEDRSSPGRLYVGVMGQYHTPVTSLVHTSAALAQAPCELKLNEASSDAYWTQVIFHNSRRELGKTMSLSRDDIPKRVMNIATSEEVSRAHTDPVEMSANIPSKDIPIVLDMLGQRFGEQDCIDVLACTNMFSVGVDVQRLGLIVMNGQPKTTAEYIQASSRVGRGDVPGIVIAFYPNNKARDRSQYESFIPYHQALYRAVEPTSVTPFALPAMERALHAALVIVMRYCAGLSGNLSAQNFNSKDATISSYIHKLELRMLNAHIGDNQTRIGISKYLNLCVDAWDNKAQQSRNSNLKLVYDGGAGTKNFTFLLRQYEPGGNSKPEIPWATLNSMRSVDTECRVYVRGEEK